MRVEDLLFPENGKLKVDEDGNMSAMIVDAELDPIEIDLSEEGIALIETAKLTYVSLSREHLLTIDRLIKEASAIHRKALTKPTPKPKTP